MTSKRRRRRVQARNHPQPQPAETASPETASNTTPAATAKKQNIFVRDPLIPGCIIFLVLLILGSSYLVVRFVRYRRWSAERATNIQELYRQSWALARENRQETNLLRSTSSPTPQPYIQGKVLIINSSAPPEYKQEFDTDTAELPAELKPEVAEDVGTIVSVFWKTESSSEYDCRPSGRAAQIYTCDVKVINRASRALITSRIMSDGPTCKASTLQKTMYQYLAALPRK